MENVLGAMGNDEIKSGSHKIRVKLINSTSLLSKNITSRRIWFIKFAFSYIKTISIITIVYL